MTKKGSITVYLSLLLAIFLMVFQVIHRSVRIAGARADLAMGIHESLYSVFARYDPILLERYDLFFLDGSFGGEILRQDLLCDLINQGVKEVVEGTGFFQKNLLKISVEQTALTGYTLATDRQGESFRKQAVEVMKLNLGSQGIRSLLLNVRKENETLEKQEQHHSGEVQQDSMENYETDLEEIRKEEKKEEVPVVPTPPEPIENPIDVIREIWKKGVLGLVVKDTAGISNKKYNSKELLSERRIESGFGLQKMAEKSDFTEQLLFQEYLISHLQCYTDCSENGGYELEYVIKGKMKDVDNLTAVVNRLLVLREASNFAHLVTSAKKQGQVAVMSTGIAASIGLPIAEGLIRKVLQACWAFGESVLDVRTLLEGGKVPLIKTEESWQLELNQLVHLLEGLDHFRKNQPEGLDYKGYLRLILLTIKEENKILRGMDMVEQGMRKQDGKETFRLDYCIGELQSEVQAKAGGVSFSLEHGYGYGEE